MNTSAHSAEENQGGPAPIEIDIDALAEKYRSELLPIIPHDARLVAGSAVARESRGKVPGRILDTGEWTGKLHAPRSSGAKPRRPTRTAPPGKAGSGVTVRAGASIAARSSAWTSTSFTTRYSPRPPRSWRSTSWGGPQACRANGPSDCWPTASKPASPRSRYIWRRASGASWSNSRARAVNSSSRVSTPRRSAITAGPQTWREPCSPWSLLSKLNCYFTALVEEAAKHGYKLVNSEGKPTNLKRVSLAGKPREKKQNRLRADLGCELGGCGFRR